MRTSTKQLQKRVIMAFAIIMGFIIISSPFQALAASSTSEYYPTWDAWVEDGNPSSTWNDAADAIEAVLVAGKELYEAGDYEGAGKAVSDAYYGYYETTGFERTVMGQISGSRVSQVELAVSTARTSGREGSASYPDDVDLLISYIREDANQLDGVSSDSSSDSGDASASSGSAATIVFAACFSIILREGFEAILIVGAILAYLRKADDEESRRKRKLRQVYIGSGLGIVLSFVLAWLLNALRLSGQAPQEIIEGVTALMAVVVLYYVSNWMLSKSESDRWNAYIKTKAADSSEKGSSFALAFTAFLAVFREGAEVVLFFQPYMGDENIGSVWAGFFVGVVVLVFVYLAIHFLSIRIPIKPFFTATSILMFLMSISFLGAGIKELIEGEVLSGHSPAWLQWIPYNDVLDVLGIYPILETIIPQLILLIISVVIFVTQTRKNNRIHAEAEAKRAEERAIKEAEEKKKAEEEFEAKVREIVLKVINEQAGSK